jgi:energy-coupling factor transport system permease protein
MKKIRLIMVLVIGYLLINTVISFFFNPYYGVEIYGTRHELFKLIGNVYVTQEQLFYEFTKLLKYLSMIPLGLLFLLTTNPSEFASSLNKVGVPYKAAYGFALTLRYFPDLQKDYVSISKSQQARGIEMTAKASLMSRIKNALLILMPLIFSSLERVDNISNAMDLRGFGKHKKRTWYTSKKMTHEDYLAILISLVIMFISLGISIFVNGSRFYNPFI